MHKSESKEGEGGEGKGREAKGDERRVVEQRLVVQAVRLNTHSKLTFSDSVLFDGLIRDVFPGVEFQDFVYEKLTVGIYAVYFIKCFKIM